MGIVACDKEENRPDFPQSGDAVATMNGELWTANAEAFDREQTGGEFDPLDIVVFGISEKRVRQQEFVLVLLFDQIKCGRDYPLTFTATDSMSNFNIDSIQGTFFFFIEDGEIAGAAYKLHPGLGVSNTVTFDCDEERDNVFYISWSAGFLLREGWRHTADEFGFPDTVIFRDGRATLELP